jgi:hypothetical protein
VAFQEDLPFVPKGDLSDGLIAPMEGYLAAASTILKWLTARFRAQTCRPALSRRAHHQTQRSGFPPGDLRAA